MRYEITDRLDRRDLKKWDTDVADLLLHLVNRAGIKVRMIDGGHLLLYPPDGSRPFKAAALRKPKTQIAYLRNQFMARHGIEEAS
jgi:hypothetical protein